MIINVLGMLKKGPKKNRPIIWHFLIQYVQATSSVIDSPTCSSPVVSTPGGFTGILLMGYHQPNK
jgi:hypothetical protein